MEADRGGLGVIGVLPPGFWAPDLAHFPKPVSQATASILVGRLSGEACARWGLLLEGVDFAVDASGWVHVRDQPVLDGDESARRRAAAEETVAKARWREEATRWTTVTRPAVVAELLAQQEVPLAALAAGELAGHIREVVATARRLLDLHMELHLTDMVPLGALLAEAEGWGLAPVEVIPLMQGASPASAPSEALRAAQRSWAATSTTPRPDRPEVEAFLRLEGHRLISEPEVAAPALHERPDLVEQLLTAPARSASSRADDVEALATDLRAGCLRRSGAGSTSCWAMPDAPTASATTTRRSR